MSLERLQEHRSLWERKPALRQVYSTWFRTLVGLLPEDGRVLEVGAGPGLLSAWARVERPDLQWVATDITAAPWNDLAGNAVHLPFRAASFEAIVALDVLHHLEDPRAFFLEATSALRPDGRICMIEPWVTPFSYPIYRWLHQEGCDLRIDPWRPFATTRDGRKEAFEGNNAIPWRLVREVAPEAWGRLGLTPPTVGPTNGFAYLLSLGFRESSLLPAPLAPRLLQLDRWLAPLARWTGMRALLVWRRAQAPPA